MVKKSVNEERSSPNKTCADQVSKQIILNELHKLYIQPNDGLLAIGKKLGLHLVAPRRKVNILILGNHSSGKSSFINWYVNDNVQKTGVAIETQGFTIVTSGKMRETLTGEATLHLFPNLQPLKSINGVLQYLNTELTSSKSRRFNLVNFIDTPGLADGELHYPYDIEKAMVWLGGIADLIFVFFDPIGQALCKRTLNLVEKLNSFYSERMRFFLTKADQAGIESDRQKVMMQIVQELCKRPGLNQCGFEMATIYIPNHSDLKIHDKMCGNQIDNTCLEVEKTIALTIQNTFNQMETDIEQVEDLATTKLAFNQKIIQFKIRKIIVVFLLALFCLQFPLSVMISKFDLEIPYKTQSYKTIIENIQLTELLSAVHRAFMLYMLFIVNQILKFCYHKDLVFYSFIPAFIALFLLWIIIRELKAMFFITQHIKMFKFFKKNLNFFRVRREELYTQYLNQIAYYNEF